MDFTIKIYKSLIETLLSQGFSFKHFRDFMATADNRVIILRHDVDLLPNNSLIFAQLQSESGIKGTYYFRITSKSYNEEIIKEINSLGHEIGYHYEDVSLAAKRCQASGVRCQGKQDKNFEKRLAEIAIKSFKENLEKLRRIVPVKTICMHGNPMSKWDSRLLWKYYDYRDFGIIGEPYFDLNFDEVFYLTDTGRRWDGDLVNIRDKTTGFGRQASGRKEWESGRVGEREPGNHSSDRVPPSPHHPVPPSFPLRFHSTFDIIKAAEERKLPDKIMMTFHPQRWTDNPVLWTRELIWQNMKNIVKYFVVKRSENT